MKHISCTVAATAAAFGTHRIVTLSAPDLPRMRAGQLLLARVNDTLDPYLPSAYFPLPAGATSFTLWGRPKALGRPLPLRGPKGRVSPTAVHAAGVRVPAARPGALALLVEADDPLGRPDATGETLELIAPVGNGFALDPATRRLLLVADAARLAPLIALAHEASQKQIAVSLLVHRSDTPDGANMAASLSEMLPLDVEYQVATDLSAVLPVLLAWADQLCAAGDSELYALLKASPGLEGRRMVAQVIVAPLMACGFGACQGCAVETVRGMRLACVDGPVFDLGEL